MTRRSPAGSGARARFWLLLPVWLALGAGLIALALLPVSGPPPAPRPPLSPLEREVGSLLMVGFEGAEPDAPGVRRTLARARAGRIGAVMFLRRNVTDRTGTTALTGALRAARPDLLVALDQEGGWVARLGRGSGFPRTPSARRVAAALTPAEAESLYEGMARGLSEWGFDVNLAPVVDVEVAGNPIIARLGRAFASDTGEVTDYARAFVRGHCRAGVRAVLKHFPGHGSSLADSHLGTADVTATWNERELAPYRALMDETGAVMIGHLTHRRLGGAVPATFSSAIVDGLLRREMGFEGVVVSDDLQMDAVTLSQPEAAVAALRAGVDVLLFSGDRDDPVLVDAIIDGVAREARRDPDFRRRVALAAERVARWRQAAFETGAAAGTGIADCAAVPSLGPNSSSQSVITGAGMGLDTR